MRTIEICLPDFLWNFVEQKALEQGVSVEGVVLSCIAISSTDESLLSKLTKDYGVGRQR